MTTFTWTLPTDFTGAWNASASDWTPGGFPTGAGANYSADDIVIASNTTLSLTGFTGGQTMHSLTLDDPNGTFTIGPSAGGINVVSSLSLNHGVIVATGGFINIGSAASSGSILIAAGSTLVGGTDAGNNTTVINGIGTSPAQLQGGGIVLAGAGLTDFQPNISVAAASTITFEIANTGNAANQSQLALEGAVNGGTVDFLGGSGLLVLTGTQVSNGTTLTNGTFAATVQGLTTGTSFTNGIDIAAGGMAAMSAQLSGVNNTKLTVWDTATPGVGEFYTFNLAGNYTGATAAVRADTAYGGFDVFLVCYATGTAIATGKGETAVESIQAGDTVMTVVDGAHVPQTVKWVGHRTLNLGRHPNLDAIAPVRIMQGALGENLPRRDLVVSPDHCLFIDGGLFPAKLLVNGMTIVRELEMETVTYHHVELERHSVMIAEGVEAESYLDTGNRAFFSNGGLATLLHPELTINENLRCWQEDACAPLMVKPEAVKPVWQRFADRAATLGFTQPVYETTTDAGVHLLVDGKRLLPVAIQGQMLSFMVPGKARSVRLMSRSARPSTLTPWLDDPRTLGVAIRSVTLRDRSGDAVIGADHPVLTAAGWYAPEQAADGTVWRWSNGDAALPMMSDEPCSVEIMVNETTTYIDDAGRLAA